MSSKCLDRYGREWSKDLQDTTRTYFRDIRKGFVKHISGTDSRYAIASDSVQHEPIPVSEAGKGIFLFSLKESSGLVFDVAYDSVDEMIDDGWAVD